MANGKGCHKIVHLDLSGCEQVMKRLGQAVINILLRWIVQSKLHVM